MAWLHVLAQYALLLLFCYRNRCFGVSMLLIGAASLCNLAAMCCNGFRMPISPPVYDYRSLLPSWRG
jgi:hypothetical protein